MKKTTEQFIKEANLIHNYFYNYDKVNYINNRTKVIITCPIHGDFEQIPYKHLQGNGCKLCAIENMKKKLKGRASSKPKRTNEDFLKEAKEVHGDKFLYLEEYKGSDIKIKMQCKKCGYEFLQDPYHHLKREQGCPKCSGNIKFTQEQWIEEARKRHNDFYDYSLVKYVNQNSKVKIICPKHGIFQQMARIHLNYGSCPACLESSGEHAVRTFLEKNNIKYVPQYKNEDCFNVNLLPFDFYLPDYNTVIEYQGKQHYTQKGFNKTEKEFLEQLKRDQIKRDFCKRNNIEEIEISYLQKVEEVLTEWVRGKQQNNL